MASTCKILLWGLLVFGILTPIAAKNDQTSVRKRPYTEASPSIGILRSIKTDWQSIQDRARDAVVQVFSFRGVFNWTAPYDSPKQEMSRGSGFFIDGEEGYVVTNQHVVDEALQLRIQIPFIGRTQFPATLVGVCPEEDIALLRLTEESRVQIVNILGKPIPFLQFGDSDKVTRAQEIMTLGYPLGMERLKSTHGMVSGRENLYDDRRGSNTYIQMTAPINPGSSGGPAFDAQGNVIGINSAATTSAQNVGWIRPINNVKSVLNNLMETSLLRRPSMRGTISNGTPDMMRMFHNPPPGGMYLANVYKGGLLERAGILPGDVLYKINGYDVDLFGEIKAEWGEDRISVQDLINRFELGQTINAELYRAGKKLNISFVYELLDPVPIRYKYPEFEPDAVRYEILGGVVIMELALNHLEEFHESPAIAHLIAYQNPAKQHKSRLIVVDVLLTSEAEKARVFIPGALISRVNGTKVRTLADLREQALLGADTGFVNVQNQSGALLTLDIAKVLHDEHRLAAIYHYEPTMVTKKVASATGITDFGRKKKKQKVDEQKR